MRPGLVVVGTVLLVLGAAAAVVATTEPTGSHVVQTVSRIPAQSILPGANSFALLTGANASEATFTVGWSATAPSNVRLFEANGCRIATLACAAGPAISAWSNATVGSWTDSDAVRFPYLVEWNTSTPGGGTWQLSAVETVSTPEPLPLWEALLIDAAAGALGLVGAVAVFLGLFLRRGVYEGPAPLVSKSADDTADLGRDPRSPR